MVSTTYGILSRFFYSSFSAKNLNSAIIGFQGISTRRKKESGRYF
jgi:hypothetical protein